VKKLLSSEKYKKIKMDILEIASTFIGTRTFFISHTTPKTFTIDSIINFNGCSLSEKTSLALKDSY
jgi:hypothetical protein